MGDAAPGARVLLHMTAVLHSSMPHPATTRPDSLGPAAPRPRRGAGRAALGMIVAATVVACGDAGGYEVSDARQGLAAALPPPSAADTVPTIVRVAFPVIYPCARLIPGVEHELARDTLMVRQAAVDLRAPFCIPYNLPVRTEGVEPTARVYPAEPHAERPGYRGWRTPG